MSSHEQRQRDFNCLVEFLLTQADSAPVKTRVPVYRALAILLGDTPAAAKLMVMANELEALDLQFREFTFRIEFPKPSDSGNGKPSNQ